MPQEKLTVLASEPGHYAFLALQNVNIAVWQEAANLPALARLRTVSDEILKRYPRGGSSVHIIRQGAALPSAEARSELARMTHDYAQQLAGVAVVLQGGGFWASAMRGAVTAIRVLGARNFDLRIHSHVDELLDWLPHEHAMRTGVELEHEPLREALRECARLADSGTIAPPGA